MLLNNSSEKNYNNKINRDETGGARSSYGKDMKYVQNSGWET